MTFLTRQDCHLCDDARQVLQAISEDIGLQIEEVDVDSDEELKNLYGLRVPVVLASHQRVIAEGIIDDKRTLRDQIEKMLGG